MSSLLQVSTLSTIIHLALTIGFSIRVIMMRPQTGVALAWILVIGALPLLGILLYISIGERRIGRRRAGIYASQRAAYGEWTRSILSQGVTDVDWMKQLAGSERMDRLALSTVGMPTITGNELELISDTEEILRRVIADVDTAQSTIHMAFYIWSAGGTADEVVEALQRAAQRGVRCRVLVDAIGSARWWRSESRRRLQAAGVEVREALEASVLRTYTARNDLRLHRKIVVIDGATAYTGSMNMVDPRFFKQDSGVGQWVDAMVRVRGPVIQALLGVFLSDWQIEGGDETATLLGTSDMKQVPAAGPSNVQVVPSGPSDGLIVEDAILQMLVKMIYAARQEIIITTPYFVPDDSMLRALRTAASQGVRVELIVPAKVDSLLVRYASRSFFDDLTQAGVRVQQFTGGLLHTKSITVDGEISMFGTVNLDMRSLWLNYEVTLFVYGADFGGRLRELQLSYLQHCTQVDRAAWLARPARSRLLENTARLVSPLL
ncbi:MAG: cardiolipin synthase [bacterium]|nr:cardiolipin synthase [bacterium]